MRDISQLLASVPASLHPQTAAMDEAGCYLSPIGGQEANGLDKRFIVAAVAAEGGGIPIRPFPT